MPLAPNSAERAFTLVEVSVAIAISALFLGSLFTMNSSSMQTVRTGRETACASQILQQRIEALRIANRQQNIVVDSYDSRDPNKSTNGLYDIAKRQENGDIATDGNLIEAGNAHIYGDVSTNAGTVSGAANITGVERTDFYQDPIPVAEPTWPSVNATPSIVTGAATLNASATKGAANSRYRLTEVVLSGGTLRLAGNPDGSQTYIDVYVAGDL